MRRTYPIMGAIFAILALGLAIPAARAATVTVQGQITNSTGPVANGTITFRSTEPVPTPFEVAVPIDGLGGYSVTAPEGSYMVSVTPPSTPTTPATTYVTSAFLTASTHTLNIAIPGGSVLSAHVTANGTPVANATIYLTPNNPNFTRFSTTTNASGDFQIGVPIGSYQYQVFNTVTLGSATPTGTVRHRYSSAVTVAGDATLPPVDFVVVNQDVNLLVGSNAGTGRVIWSGPPAGVVPGTTGYEFLANSTFTGNQTIPVLSMASSSLTVSSPTGGSPLASATVDTRTSTTTSLQISALSHVTGRVLVNTTPSQANVSLQSASPQSFFASAGTDGQFAIDAPDGDYTVFINTNQGPIRYSRQTTAHVGGATALGDLTFSTVDQRSSLSMPAASLLRVGCVGVRRIKG